ncbi:MAG: DUF6434 domain-containing protein [Bacteroidota bacterium]
MSKAKPTRPALDSSLAPGEFLDWYWLKEELVAFCKAEGLPASGSKSDVRARIAAYLTDGTVLKPKPTPRGRRDPMPDVLSRDTVIGAGWGCGPTLRAFFLREVGPAFRFNKAMRDFVHHGAGRTLGEGIDVWERSKSQRHLPIADSLEYNQHTRAYYAAHPDATREDVLAAWNEKRSRPRSEWKGG